MFCAMAADRARLASDYSVVITGSNRQKSPWAWEIQRKSKPLEVRFRGADLKSEPAARLAGEKALAEFL